MADDPNSANFKPVGYALAAALVICASATAYRIVTCGPFETTLSLDRLFSFKCQPAPGSVEQKLGSDPVPVDGPSRDALAAPTLTAPLGYISYRANDGVARDSASVTPNGGAAAMSFAKVRDGLVLFATSAKTMHSRPFQNSIGTTYPKGQCFKVIEGSRIEDEVATRHSSGGWLPVELASDCMSATHP